MVKRKLGSSGIEVSPLAFGGNVLGWTLDEPGSFRVLDAFVDEGFELVDTADVYSRWAPGNRGGESETILGKWLARSGKRDKVVVATKVGMEVAPGRKGLSRGHILRSAEESLRRLRTDRIDVYFAHADDPETSFEETLDAFGQLVRQGKVRAVGASNISARRLAEAMNVSRGWRGLPAYSVLQPLYNLYDRAEYEASLEPVCRAEGLGVVTYSSLASGFLTGKYRSAGDLAGKARGESVRGYLDARGARILDALDRLAKELSVRPASVALAWLASRPTVTAPIASATTVEQLGDLVASTRIRLDGGALRLLEEASGFDEGSVRGAA